VIEPAPPRPQGTRRIPVEERSYPTFKQIQNLRKLRQNLEGNAFGTNPLEWVKVLPPFAIVLWSIFALVFGCVLIGIGSSFDGGGCLIGIGFLVAAFALVGIFAGAARSGRNRR
jgi:hypothetical protein